MVQYPNSAPRIGIAAFRYCTVSHEIWNISVLYPFKRKNFCETLFTDPSGSDSHVFAVGRHARLGLDDVLLGYCAASCSRSCTRSRFFEVFPPFTGDREYWMQPRRIVSNQNNLHHDIRSHFYWARRKFENNKFDLFISQSSGLYTLGHVPTNVKEVLDKVRFEVP